SRSSSTRARGKRRAVRPPSHRARPRGAGPLERQSQVPGASRRRTLTAPRAPSNVFELVERWVVTAGTARRRLARITEATALAAMPIEWLLAVRARSHRTMRGVSHRKLRAPPAASAVQRDDLAFSPGHA